MYALHLLRRGDMKKYSITALLMIFTLSVMLAACGADSGGAPEDNDVTGQTSASPDKKVTIRIATINREENRKEFLDLIKEKLPHIAVDYNFIDNNTFTDVVTTQLISGAGPDIIEGFDPKWVNNGYLMDLSDQPFVSQFYETGLKENTVDGKVFGIPTTGWFEGVWYNKAIFEQNQLESPKTFDEWLAIHDKLKQNGIKPQAMGAQSWEPMMKQAMSMAFNEFYDKPENGSFDNDLQTGKRKFSELTEAFKIWDEMIQRQNITPEMLGITYDQALDEFASGKAAMWESGPWSYEMMMKKNPDLELGMFPLPGKTSAVGYLIGGPGVPWTVNENSKHKEEALQVLNLMATPEAQKALMKTYFGPSFLKGFDDPELPDPYKGVEEAFTQGRVYAPWPNWGPLSGNTFITEVGKLLQDHLAGGKTIEEVLQGADKKAEQLIKQAQ
ncbi:ABC transporter substrate-binding protein [Cohnella cellulosilytica]|uniref:ABC transporter substrate-binding protein n=2 Tax=Cohnella cellulosilytica TaxID=986710 RepID=A0ABW2F493_9BACL